MKKATVTRVFVGSMAAVVAGIVLAVVAAWMTFGSGAFVMDGPDVVGVDPTAGSWSMVGLMILGGLAVIGGLIGGLVSWIGALLNTAHLDDKTWFIILLVLGLCSFGLVAMIAYVIAGPDGLAPPVRPQAVATPA
jgi:H+/Cl- antiporter ClcA